MNKDRAERDKDGKGVTTSRGDPPFPTPGKQSEFKPPNQNK
jgi:hypothetical protein